MSQPGQTPDPGENAVEPPSPAATAPPSASIPSETRTKWFKLRGELPLWQSLALSLTMIVLVFLGWYVLTYGEVREERILSPAKMPSPYEVMRAFPNDLWNAESSESHLFYNTLTTLRRVALGFLLATLIGVPLGVLAGCFRPVEAFIFPLIIFGRNIPIAALTMLTFLLFGIAEFQKVMFIFVACFAFVTADTTQSIKDVAQRYIDTSYTLGAHRWQAIYKVIVPLALPNIFNSLRLLFGLAFGYIMLVELVTLGDEVGGLGHLINVGQRLNMNERIYAIVLIIPCIAFVIDYGLYLLQCVLFPYRYGAENANNLVLRGLKASLLLFWKPAASTTEVAPADASPPAEGGVST